MNTGFCGWLPYSLCSFPVVLVNDVPDADGGFRCPTHRVGSRWRAAPIHSSTGGAREIFAAAHAAGGFSGRQPPDWIQWSLFLKIMLLSTIWLFALQHRLTIDEDKEAAYPTL